MPTTPAIGPARAAIAYAACALATLVGLTSAAGADVGAGYWHTNGHRIEDSANQPIRIAGINWFGLETSNFAPHGLWARGYRSMLDQIKAQGFNTIRLPYSNQLFDAGSTPNGIDFAQNPDLAGLTGVQIMDKIVAYAGQIGLRILLDRHRPDAAGAVRTLVHRELRRSALDPRLDDARGTLRGQRDGDRRRSAQRAARCRVLGVRRRHARLAPGRRARRQRDPRRQSELADHRRRRGELRRKELLVGRQPRRRRRAPVRLNVANRLVYSIHDYPASVYAQPWFSAPNYPNNLPALWDATWGYLHRTGTAPVLVGEFGTRLATTSDQQWLTALASYLGTGVDGIHWTFWSWNPNSADTGGILKDDWQTIDQAKQSMLVPLQFRSGTVTSTPPPPKISVVEYYNATLDHYFLTPLAAEQANLDAGLTPTRWTRTGKAFNAFESSGAGFSAVCRFYIPPALGDSHFFGRGAAECSSTAAKNPSFVVEAPAFFYSALPTAGTCPGGTAPVYRLFSNRADANHRYTTDRDTRDQMVAKGWLAEGDGPDFTVMCAPP